jgi:hypothetical protein
MTSPSPRSAPLLDIPQEHLPITTHTGKPRIVCGNGYVKD